MQALFVELPAFSRYREEYLDDDAYSDLQKELLANPEKGDLIQGTGGLRKVRAVDVKRGKGKRSGSRVIYYYYVAPRHFLLFTIYGKDIQKDLTPEQKRNLANMLKTIKGEQ